jgi:hypothetical protein
MVGHVGHPPDELARAHVLAGATAGSIGSYVVRTPACWSEITPRPASRPA